MPEQQYSSNKENLKRLKKKKRGSFILLELLIALSLITMSAGPLLKNPMKMFKDELFALKKIELQRIAEIDFAHLKESLYLNEISWKEIEQSSETSPFFLPTEKKEAKLDEDFTLFYEKKCSLWIFKKNSLQGNEKEEISLINAKITYRILSAPNTPVSFSHRLFFKKKTKAVD